MVSKMAFIGGDLRMPESARFARNKCDVLSVYGFDKYEYCYECFGINQEKTLETALLGAEIVVLGLPCSADGRTVYAPYCSKEISFEQLFKCLSPGCKFFCGKPFPELLNIAVHKDISCFDYFSREELTLKNALITVEGALQTAMQETPYTLHGSNCLVLGYGRIGKMLSSALLKLGAKVSCTARKTCDLALMECNNITPVHTNDIATVISSYNIIFNTIPDCILNESILTFVRDNTLIIDLASKPGGVDFECARRMGLKVIWATALPGKVAPETSGKIITETIFNIISETEKGVKK